MNNVFDVFHLSLASFNVFECVAGRIGLMSRLFGSVEPEEVREQKLSQLEVRLQSSEQNVEDNKLTLR